MTRVNEELHQEIARLRQRIEYLEAENLMMKEAVIPAQQIQKVFKVSRTQSQIIEILSDGRDHPAAEIASKFDDTTSTQTVHVFIYRIRKKLPWLTIHKEANHWSGYRLTKESRAELRERLQKEMN